MQILSVKAENFKGLKLVEVEPEKVATIVGGKNRAGKSSLLDAIAATLGGKKLCPAEPIREGEDEARCEIQLDGEQKRMLPPCTVIRTWKRRKTGSIASELEITTEDGYKAPTPQTILDDVVGPLGFDPERFLRMKPKEQAEVLRGLVGLDFTELDQKRQELYSQRTEVNRNGKAMKSRFDAMPCHADAPKEEVSVSALMTELQRRQAVNRQHNEVRNELTALQQGVKTWERQLADADSAIDDLEQKLKQAKERRNDIDKKRNRAATEVTAKQAEVDALQDEDEQEIKDRITDSESVNRKVRENADRALLSNELEAERKKSADLTKQIEDIDATKQNMREAAEWPVPGLGYDENGVTLMDRPFDQACAAEQREAAFGIVAALNPTLKFSFIKDGSLLDEEELDDFARIAAEKGFQLFVERVGDGKECTVVIADGEIEEK